MRYHLDSRGLLLFTSGDDRGSEWFTSEPPPEVGRNEAAQVIDGVWHVVPDWRRVQLYQKATGAPARLLDAGITPDAAGMTPLRPEPMYVWDEENGKWVPPGTPQYDTAVRAAALAAVDAAADACRLLVVGDPLRVVEYQRAAEEAKHYIDTGEALPAVTSWAAAKGWTNQQAAENILDESRAWNTVLYAIRDIRLESKESIRTASLDQVTSIRDSAKVALRNLIIGVGNAASP